VNEAGQSCVIFDGPDGIVAGEGVTTTLLWQTDEAPASNEGNAEGALEPSSFKVPRGGTKFVLARFPPGAGADSYGMHASNTLDYGVVLSGRLTLVLEAEEVELNPGDFIIDRGVLHGWRNSGREDATVLWTVLDAKPTARPATV
jgi:quercetin dioxygenase-like cupin family protein